jgi:hypothetical protein
MTNGEGRGSAEESLRDVLIILTIATLVTAVALELAKMDASKAWDAFSAVVGLLVGQHVPKPQSASKLPFIRR